MLATGGSWGFAKRTVALVYHGRDIALLTVSRQRANSSSKSVTQLSLSGSRCSSPISHTLATYRRFLTQRHPGSMRVPVEQAVWLLQTMSQHQRLIREQGHRRSLGDDLAFIQHDHARA